MGWTFELDICFLLISQYVFCQYFYDLYLTTEDAEKEFFLYVPKASGTHKTYRPCGAELYPKLTKIRFTQMKIKMCLCEAQ